MKRTSKNYLSYEEEKCARKEYDEYLITCKGVKHLDALLLDSSLISPTKLRGYYYKIIDCGEYKQVYYYNKYKVKTDNNLVPNVDINNLYKKENINKKNDESLIDIKNINRSKFNMQRLIKANEREFKTFITLTFEENLTDLTQANKIFSYWVDSVRRVKKNFKYVCVPEFQKRGAVHYHLLTSLDIKKDNDIIIKQEGKRKCYDVKYWSRGFSSVFSMENINVVGYLTKYMTKDIDNRLFGRKRYLFSKNLVIPKEYYVDCSNDNEFYYLLDIINNYNIVFEKEYLDYYENKINFIEYKIKE